MTHKQKARQITSITLDVFKLNGQLIEWGNRLCAPYGLTSARWQVLGAITLMNSPCTIPQIAEYMGMTRQGALKQVQFLEQNGWVKAQENPHHKRSLLYMLTSKGEETYETIAQDWQNHLEAISNHFSNEALQSTEKVLTTMLALYPKIPET